MDKTKLDVALFATCLVDLFRPSVGFASIKLLEDAGCQVTVPRAQTCCGQPAYNSGDRETARRIGEAFISAFSRFDYIVLPSASCASMLKNHLPQLFDEASKLQRHAQELSQRIFEISDFLISVLKISNLATHFDGRVVFHDGCSGKRELGLDQAPRQLLKMIEGVDVVEPAETETCCGFGGTFSVHYPDISNAMAGKRCASLSKNHPSVIAACELGCLLQLSGTLSRQDSTIECRHIVEILSGCDHQPAIGKGKSKT